jgi:hypothetical protein
VLQADGSGAGRAQVQAAESRPVPREGLAGVRRGRAAARARRCQWAAKPGGAEQAAAEQGGDHVQLPRARTQGCGLFCLTYCNLCVLLRRCTLYWLDKIPPYLLYTLQIICLCTFSADAMKYTHPSLEILSSCGPRCVRYYLAVLVCLISARWNSPLCCYS